MVTKWRVTPFKIKYWKINTHVRKLCPSPKRSFIERETTTKWKSLWRCQQFVLKWDNNANRWPHLVPILRCSACISQCVLFVSTVLYLCKTLVRFDFCTRWQSDDEIWYQAQWGSSAANWLKWKCWVHLCNWPLLMTNRSHNAFCCTNKYDYNPISKHIMKWNCDQCYHQPNLNQCGQWDLKYIRLHNESHSLWFLRHNWVCT